MQPFRLVRFMAAVGAGASGWEQRRAGGGGGGGRAASPPHVQAHAAPPPPLPPGPLCLGQVKCWAKAHQLNDSQNGTFNSWSLTLMVRATLVWLWGRWGFETVAGFGRHW